MLHILRLSCTVAKAVAELADVRGFQKIWPLPARVTNATPKQELRFEAECLNKVTEKRPLMAFNRCHSQNSNIDVVTGRELKVHCKACHGTQYPPCYRRPCDDVVCSSHFRFIAASYGSVRCLQPDASCRCRYLRSSDTPPMFDGQERQQAASSV